MAVGPTSPWYRPKSSAAVYQKKENNNGHHVSLFSCSFLLGPRTVSYKEQGSSLHRRVCATGRIQKRGIFGTGKPTRPRVEKVFAAFFAS